LNVAHEQRRCSDAENGRRRDSDEESGRVEDRVTAPYARLSAIGRECLAGEKSICAREGPQECR
jgi:hypothetical protein